MDCDIDENLTPSTPSSDDEGGIRQRLLEKGAESDQGFEFDESGAPKVRNSYERLVAEQDERERKGIRCEIVKGPVDDEITEDVPPDYQERLGRHNVPRKADLETLRGIQRKLQSEVNSLKSKAKTFRMHVSKYNKGHATYTDFDRLSLLRWVREGKRGVLGKIPFAGWGLRWEYLARLQIGIEHKRRQLEKIRNQIHSLQLFRTRFNDYQKETAGVLDMQFMITKNTVRMNQQRFEQLLIARQSWECTFETMMYAIDCSGTYKTVCTQLGRQHCQKDGPSVVSVIRQIILQVSADAPSVSRATPPDMAWEQIMVARFQKQQEAEAKRACKPKRKACRKRNMSCKPDPPSESVSVETVSVDTPFQDLGAHRELYYLFENVEHSLMEVLLDVIKLESRAQYWCDEMEGNPTAVVGKDFLEDWEKPVVFEVPSEDVSVAI
ncbi:unnamed protein product [Notodromas monacha]|uniref:Uncharacterized protein n=1 Tax=Notodromas monacha TaxID=399045 RepID=A0A7R9BGN1_9CRUS|nr:unnamed protein product [Notodromas monacha]CAG0915136.1 unnamed protein product [Notodromas monacha]